MVSSGNGRRFRIGTYGAGTLWCATGPDGVFILFNEKRIARRGQPITARSGTWVSLELGWRITPFGGTEVLVQHKQSDGVVVSLRGGKQ
jgi:hypothetical protein